MEVILLEKIIKLGDVGDVVDVKNGYGRNFLIPQGKALRANNDNKAFFEAEKSRIEKENQEKREVAEKDANKIEGKFVIVTRQAGEDGRLFGSVGSKDIAEKIEESLKVKIKRSQISLDKPVKYIGIFQERVTLYGDVIAVVNVNVARSAEEAEAAKKEFLNPKSKKDENEVVSEPNVEKSEAKEEPEESEEK